MRVSIPQQAYYRHCDTQWGGAGPKDLQLKKPGLAQKMQELGCTEALNLDGGGTAAMMFMGEVLNRSDKKMRSVSTLIGFGKSEQITE